MKPSVGVLQFAAVCPESDEASVGRGITRQVAQRLATIAELEVSSILLGREALPPPAESDAAPSSSSMAARTPALFVAGLGKECDSDFILVGRVHIHDGLIIHFRVFESRSGRLIHSGCVSGVRTGVFSVLDELALEAGRAMGFIPDSSEGLWPEPEPVDFEAFLEYCAAQEEEQPEAVRDLLDRALAVQPHFRMALFERMQACYGVDDPAGLVQVVDAYVNARPEDTEVVLTAANLCLSYGMVEEGIVYAKACLARSPEDVEARVLLARFLFDREDLQEASSHLEVALSAQTRTVDGAYALGRYFLDLGQYKRAQVFLEECLEMDPGSYVVLRDLQCCYYELEEFERGVEACESLLEVDPSDAGTWYNLGLIYQKTGRIPLAVKHHEEALRHDPEFTRAATMIAECYYRIGDYRKALSRFLEAAWQGPDHGGGCGRIGDCYFELASMEESLLWYGRAEEADSAWSNPRHELVKGAAALTDGDVDAALARFATATRSADDCPVMLNDIA